MADDNDMDLPDIEEAELSEDSWDEFDEESQKEDSAALQSKPKKKGGSALFVVVIVAIVALGGGAYFGGKFLFPPAPPSAQSESPASPTETSDTAQAPPSANGVVELSDTNAPPMPAPIEPPTASDSTNAAATGATEAAPAPTALPEATPAASKPVEAAGLIPMPQPGDKMPEDAAPEEQQANLNASQDLANALAKDIPPSSAQGSATPEQSASSPMPPATDIKPLELKPPGAPAELPPAASAEIPPANAAPDQAATDTRKDFDAEKKALQEQLDDANAKVADLQKSVDALNKQLAETKQAAASQEPAAEKPRHSAQTVRVPKSPKSARPIEEVPSSGGATSAESAFAVTPQKGGQWELRSAQSGQALLAPRGSNELTTVKVGDLVPGLGRIIAINQVGSVWTVQGTQGQVYR